jgi:hypothetical protein
MQGNRILTSQYFTEIVFISASFESFGFDATPGCPYLLEQIEGHMPQYDKVLLTVVLAHATAIFFSSLSSLTSLSSITSFFI